MMKWFAKQSSVNLEEEADGLSIQVDQLSLASSSDDEISDECIPTHSEPLFSEADDFDVDPPVVIVNDEEYSDQTEKHVSQVLSESVEESCAEGNHSGLSKKSTKQIRPVQTSLFWDDEIANSHSKDAGPPIARATNSDSLDVVCAGLQAAMGICERSRWLNVVSKDPVLSAVMKKLDDDFPTAMYQMTEEAHNRASTSDSVHSPAPTSNYEHIKVHARNGIDSLEIRRKKTESTAEMCSAIVRKAARVDPPRDKRIAGMMAKFGVPDSWSELDVLFHSDKRQCEDKLKCAQITDDWVLGVHKAPNLRVGLDVQGWMCIDCSRKFSATDLTKNDRADSLPRFCDYYGYYFCTECHGGEKSIVPAKIISAWNFNVFPVSDKAFRFLRSVHEVPVLKMLELAPDLVTKVKPLRLVIDLRNKLKHMEQFIKMCAAASQQPTANGFLGTMFASLDRYLLETSDTFSLNDLMRIYNMDLLHDLEPLAKAARSHILKCETCSSRAHVCVRCNDISDRLFPFEDRVSRCNACGALSHSPKCPRREAPKTNSCPKCVRIQKLRQRQTILVGDA